MSELVAPSFSPSIYKHGLMIFQLKTELARIEKSILGCSSWHKLPVALLSFPLAWVFCMKMYFKYIKYMQILFQLQNTQHFC